MAKILKVLALVGALLGALQPMGISAVFTAKNLVYGSGALAVLGFALAYANQTGIRAWWYGMKPGLPEKSVVKDSIENGANINPNDNVEAMQQSSVQSGLLQDDSQYGPTDENVSLGEVDDSVVSQQFDEIASLSLYNAVIAKNLELVKQLVDEAFADVNKHYNDGTFLLFLAAEKGYFDIVKYLIENGANVNEKVDNSRTPLHTAAEKGYFNIVKYLIENGANVNEKNANGRTALRHAAYNGHLGVVQYLVAHGAKVDTKDTWRCTALHYAAWYGYLEIVKYLVEQGANIDATNYDGDTPLALTRGTEIKEYLTACRTFKMGVKTEIEKYVEGRLTGVDDGKAKKNFTFLCEVVLSDPTHPGILYRTIKNKFNDFNQQKFGFAFKTIKEFYLHLLDLRKLAPPKPLLRGLFGLCNTPLKFEKTSNKVGGLTFEEQLTDKFEEIFESKNLNETEKQDVVEQYKKIKSLYRQEFQLPVRIFSILGQQNLKPQVSFKDIKINFKK